MVGSTARLYGHNREELSDIRMTGTDGIDPAVEASRHQEVADSARIVEAGKDLVAIMMADLM